LQPYQLSWPGSGLRAPDDLDSTHAALSRSNC
jgi:hypothetical protein